MPRTAYKIAENQPGKIGISLTAPSVTDPCSATLADFADLDASCQIISASIPVSQSVERDELPAVYCSPTPLSNVKSVTDQYQVAITMLMDENVVAGVSRFLFEHSGQTAWVYIGTDGDDPPKGFAEVRLAAPEIFGEVGATRQVSVTFEASGKPSICFGDSTASAAVGGADPNNISATYPAAAALADLSTLKSDATSGDTGTGDPYNGGTGTAAAFSGGQYIVLADGSQAHWDGSAWLVGAA